MTDLFEPTKPETLSHFIGKHFIYTYDIGRQSEMYLKADCAPDKLPADYVNRRS
ncbi:phenolic acid decarboxylase [Sodalis sp. dw_96]|uniref:phenolic acid decarboxylase n=1 Tax=Sodalis sp. dw_96 TaxID=2719794 RepID=UPI001BD5C2AB|nr:phenolic acid decarboxylase [Sodalis sp. dw_96]